MVNTALIVWLESKAGKDADAGAFLRRPPRRELARRVSGDIEVALYWSARDDSTSVEIRQSASGVTQRFTVAPERALDAFYHPFARLPISFDA